MAGTEDRRKTGSAARSEEVITSRQNRTVVEVGKLTDRREREERGLFRFDGVKLLGEAVRQGVRMPCLLLRESRVGAVEAALAETVATPLFECADRGLTLADGVFDKISEEKSPEGVICIGKYLDKCKKIATIYSEGAFPADGERIVLLESVRDPSNVGAILRSAAALGVDRLILSEDCADVYNPRAVRASMGALFGQRIDRVGDLCGVIGQLRERGRRVFAAALDESAVRLGELEVRSGDCVVIGNEGHGLSDGVLRAADGSVYIPMSGRTESFNAAVAASILMWEFAKQH